MSYSSDSSSRLVIAEKDTSDQETPSLESEDSNESPTESDSDEVRATGKDFAENAEESEKEEEDSNVSCESDSEEKVVDDEETKKQELNTDPINYSSSDWSDDENFMPPKFEQRVDMLKPEISDMVSKFDVKIVQEKQPQIDEKSGSECGSSVILISTEVQELDSDQGTDYSYESNHMVPSSDEEEKEEKPTKSRRITRSMVGSKRKGSKPGPKSNKTRTKPKRKPSKKKTRKAVAAKQVSRDASPVPLTEDHDLVPFLDPEQCVVNVQDVLKFPSQEFLKKNKPEEDENIDKEATSPLRSSSPSRVFEEPSASISPPNEKASSSKPRANETTKSATSTTIMSTKASDVTKKSSFGPTTVKVSEKPKRKSKKAKKQHAQEESSSADAILGVPEEVSTLPGCHVTTVEEQPDICSSIHTSVPDENVAAEKNICSKTSSKKKKRKSKRVSDEVVVAPPSKSPAVLPSSDYEEIPQSSLEPSPRTSSKKKTKSTSVPENEAVTLSNLMEDPSPSTSTTGKKKSKKSGASKKDDSPPRSDKPSITEKPMDKSVHGKTTSPPRSPTKDPIKSKSSNLDEKANKKASSQKKAKTVITPSENTEPPSFSPPPPSPNIHTRTPREKRSSEDVDASLLMELSGLHELTESVTREPDPPISSKPSSKRKSSRIRYVMMTDSSEDETEDMEASKISRKKKSESDVSDFSETNADKESDDEHPLSSGKPSRNTIREKNASALGKATIGQPKRELTKKSKDDQEKCQHCNSYFSPKQLINHVRQTHMLWHCAFCNQEMKIPTLRNHLLNNKCPHMDENLRALSGKHKKRSCPVEKCRYSSNKWEDFQEHFIRYHPNIGKPFFYPGEAPPKLSAIDVIQSSSSSKLLRASALENEDNLLPRLESSPPGTRIVSLKSECKTSGFQGVQHIFLEEWGMFSFFPVFVKVFHESGLAESGGVVVSYNAPTVSIKQDQKLYKRLETTMIPRTFKQEVADTFADGKIVLLSYNATDSDVSIMDFEADQYAPTNMIREQMANEIMDNLPQNLEQEGNNYASDIDGSLFEPNHRGWNLNALDNDLTCTNTFAYMYNDGGIYPMTAQGINTPFLYIGKYGTVFTLHKEDGNLHGISYLHYGAPKVWYIFRPEDARRIEECIDKACKVLSKSCEGILRHKHLIPHPSLFDKWNIPYSTVYQEAKQYVVVAPGAYHMGVNLGFNVAEAINFHTKETMQHFKMERYTCYCATVPHLLPRNRLVAKHDPENYDAFIAGKNMDRYPFSNVTVKALNDYDRRVEYHKKHLEWRKKNDGVNPKTGHHYKPIPAGFERKFERLDLTKMHIPKENDEEEESGEGTDDDYETNTEEDASEIGQTSPEQFLMVPVFDVGKKKAKETQKRQRESSSEFSDDDDYNPSSTAIKSRKTGSNPLNNPMTSSKKTKTKK